MSGNNQPNRPNIDLNEAFEKVNRVGNQIAGAFCDLATPIISEIATSINTTHNMNNTSTFGNNTTTFGNNTTSFTTNTNNNNINRNSVTDLSFKPNFKRRETNSNIFLLVFIPGLAKKDIKLKIIDSHLDLKGQTNILSDTHWTDFNERFYQIKFKVPNNTRNQDLFVEYQYGVLKIVVTKNNIQDSTESIVIN